MGLSKKFLIWQVIILLAIMILVILGRYYSWLDWIAIVFGIFEAIILYAHFRTKEENQYVLPASVARTMKAAPEQLSHEMTIMSTSLIIIGGIAFAIYYAIYVPAELMVKIFIIFNSLCLAIFMLAQLQTAFRQYVALMETKALIQNMQSETIEVVKNVK